jgi:hypothetical protein
VAVPVHAPLHPEKLSLLVGVAVSVMAVFWGKLAAHVVGQLIPAGLLVTTPVPLPAVVTVSDSLVALNVALTFSAAAMVRVQAAVPEHAPLHPEKTELLPAVAVSVIFVFWAKFAVHVVGQLIPAGLLVTTPLPLPAVATVSDSIALNVAETFSAAVTVKVQLAVPEQAPLQPAKT